MNRGKVIFDSPVIAKIMEYASKRLVAPYTVFKDAGLNESTYYLAKNKGRCNRLTIKKLQDLGVDFGDTIKYM